MRTLHINDDIANLGPFAKRMAPKLAKLNLKTIEDLLFYLPYRHDDLSVIQSISALTPGSVSTIQGTVTHIEKKYAPWRRSSIVEAVIEDASHDAITAIWYHSPYLANALTPGTQVHISGKPQLSQGKLRFLHPVWEKADSGESVHTGRLVPAYHLIGSLTQKQIRALIALALERLPHISDYLPSSPVHAGKFLSLDRAVRIFHFPPNWHEKNEAERRLKFDELFLLQLRSSITRAAQQSLSAHTISFDESGTKIFVKNFPFTLTQCQRKASWEIIKNIGESRPMNRLLEGDVGSGKTAVAAIAISNVLRAKFQSAYLAPTSILATQQFEVFCRYFDREPYTLALITQKDMRIQRGNMIKKISQAEMKKLLAKDGIDFAIGTHALLSEYVSLPRLALVIVDEQHRFGVRQRHSLLQRPQGMTPHLLSMTATPIPRSLALAVYGDLDISILDEKPSGRASITTKIILPPHRKDAYDLVRSEISKGHQAFIVCPLIDPSDRLGIKSVTQEVLRLKREHFPAHNLSLLHGRMSAREKDKVMKEFTEGDIDVLVATPVIEVGIDMPNATVIMIEAAERFGLAQLHQLRGRVGRGNHPSWCLLASETENTDALQRLSALVQSQDGFKLAELDLSMRGPGRVYGTTQTGFLDELKIAKLTDTIILKQAKEAVARLLSVDPQLSRNSAVKARLTRFEQTVHFE